MLTRRGFLFSRAPEKTSEKTRAETTPPCNDAVHDRLRLADGRDLAETLINAKLARAYAGGARQGWCG